MEKIRVQEMYTWNMLSNKLRSRKITLQLVYPSYTEDWTTNPILNMVCGIQPDCIEVDQTFKHHSKQLTDLIL